MIYRVHIKQSDDAHVKKRVVREGTKKKKTIGQGKRHTILDKETPTTPTSSSFFALSCSMEREVMASVIFASLAVSILKMVLVTWEC